MKLKIYLEKQVQKALDYQDEHPVSNSAKTAVKEARLALRTYMEEVELHEAQLQDNNKQWERNTAQFS